MTLWMISRIVGEACKSWGSDTLKEWLNRISTVLLILNNVSALLMLIGISYSIKRALQTREDSIALITNDGSHVDDFIEDFYNAKLQGDYTIDSGYRKISVVQRPLSTSSREEGVLHD